MTFQLESCQDKPSAVMSCPNDLLVSRESLNGPQPMFHSKSLIQGLEVQQVKAFALHVAD